MGDGPIQARRVVGSLAYGLKSRLAEHPWIALPIARVRGRGEVLGPDTDVVIESFPRCASSFAVAAFRLAQEPRPMRIANHTHMPAQVLAAVARGIPAMVLIREPEATVLSHVIHTPHLSIQASLRGYVRFHEPLLAVRDGFVVGMFEEVTSDFGLVIERLNRRFGTSFGRFEHKPANIERLEGEIEADYRSRAGSTEELERTIPRPSAVREQLKSQRRPEYASVPVGLRSRAREVFERLLPTD